MSDAQPVADGLGVVDILAGAAAARPLHRLAMIVKLERHPDHLGAGARSQRGDDAEVDAARHRHDDPRRRGVLKVEIWGHAARALYSKFTLSG